MLPVVSGRRDWALWPGLANPPVARQSTTQHRFRERSRIQQRACDPRQRAMPESDHGTSAAQWFPTSPWPYHMHFADLIPPVYSCHSHRYTALRARARDRAGEIQSSWWAFLHADPSGAFLHPSRWRRSSHGSNPIVSAPLRDQSWKIRRERSHDPRQGCFSWSWIRHPISALNVFPHSSNPQADANHSCSKLARPLLDWNASRYRRFCANH